MKSYQNYIFDLYGTLIDIHTDEYSKNFFKAYTKWLRKQGFYFSWREFWMTYTRIEKRYRSEPSVHSKPEIDITRVFADVFWTKGYLLDEEQIAVLAQSFRWISLYYLKLFSDTLPCLEGLKKAGKKVYLLSNAQRAFTWKELELTGILPFFDGVLISSDEGCMKPDPDFYQILCDRYQLDKSECVMIGNELRSDVMGANAAGIDSFYIKRYAKSEDTSMCTYVSKDGSLMEVLLQTGVKCAK